uniref:Uncharacterized protein n=1 Tax=Oryza meridionalis TaxID=40149 RepID=A0A0E0F6V1_9ORYZ
MNHSMIDTGLVTSAPSALGCTPGGTTSGGNITHFLAPLITAFHADVERREWKALGMLGGGGGGGGRREGREWVWDLGKYRRQMKWAEEQI